MKKENQIHPLGICHRIFNFLTNYVIGRGMKRVTLGSCLAKPNGEEKMPLQATGRSKEPASSEAIEIRFKHNEEEEDDDLVYRSPIEYHKLGPSVPQGINSTLSFAGNKMMPISLSETGPMKGPLSDNKARKNHRRGRVTQPDVFGHGATANGKGGIGPQGMVEPNMGMEEEMAERKCKNVVWATQQIEQEVEPKVIRPMNVMAQNINERSENFINNKKEAMRIQELKES